MNTSLHYYRAGMSPGLGQCGSGSGGTGSGSQSQQQCPSIAVTATGAATAATQIINGKYLSGVGTALLTAAPYTGPAAPFVAVAGAAAEILGAIGIGQGCGQTCITATAYANQAEDVLRQNLNTYMAQPTPRYQSAQTAALNIFDTVWAGLVSVQACGNPMLGDAGKRCITDRQRGSCKYTGSDGKCWNWFVGYRDPIANDPNVVSDAAAAGSSVTGALTSTGIDPTWLMIGGGVAVAFLLIQGMSS